MVELIDTGLWFSDMCFGNSEYIISFHQLGNSYLLSIQISETPEVIHNDLNTNH